MKMELVRVEELPFMFTYLAYIYQMNLINLEPTANLHVRDLLMQKQREEFSLLMDKATDDEQYQQYRRNFPPALKHFFDSLDLSIGLSLIFRGLKRFTQVCANIGIIKPLPYGDEKLVYESRFRAFECIQVPNHIPYSSYKETLDKENAEEDSFNILLDEAKKELTSG